MAKIGDSLDHFIVDFIPKTGLTGAEREHVLGTFHRMMDDMCSGGFDALTELTDLRRELQDLARQQVEQEHKLDTALAQVDEFDPADPGRARMLADLRAECADLRAGLEESQRRVRNNLERVETRLEPLV